MHHERFRPPIQLDMRNLLVIGICLSLFILGGNSSIAQTFLLEQGQNSGINRPVKSPVKWGTGDLYKSNSRYAEGQSVPYRLTVSKLRQGFKGIIVIEWDTRFNAKSTIAYLTGFDRICEVVEPVRGFPFGSSAYNYTPIPAPGESTGMPRTSFNNLPASERRLAIFGGTFGEIKYIQQKGTTSSRAKTRLSIEFTATGKNSGSNNSVVIAWGGPTASEAD